MLAKKIALTFTIKVSASLCAYLVSILLIRKGGTETAGQFYEWVAYLLLASSFVRFGLDHKIVKDIAQSSKQAKNETLGKLLLTCGLLSTITIPLIYFLSIKISNNTDYVSVIIATSCLIFSITYLFGNIFQGLNRADLTIFVQEILIWLVLFVYLIFYDKINLDQSWLLYLAGLFLSLLISSYILHSKFNIKPYFCSRNKLKAYIKETLPYFSGIAGHVALQWLPLIFLSLFATPIESGQFVAIYRTSMLIAFILGIFNLVTNPIYAKHFAKGDFISVGKLARSVSLFMTIVSLPLFTLLSIFSDDLMAMFGHSFKHLSAILIYIAFAQMFNAVTGSAGYILTMGGQAKLVEKNTILTLVIVSILGPLLTYKYSLWGAATISFISVITFNTLNVIGLYRNMNIFILPTLGSIKYDISLAKKNLIKKLPI